MKLRLDKLLFEIGRENSFTSELSTPSILSVGDLKHLTIYPIGASGLLTKDTIADTAHKIVHNAGHSRG